MKLDPNFMQQLPSKATLYIYGSGFFGQAVYENLHQLRPDLKIKGFVDSFRSSQLNGLAIFHIDEFIKLNEKMCYVVLASEFYWKTMQKNLSSISCKFVVPRPVYQYTKKEKNKIDTVRKKIKIGLAIYDLVIKYWETRDNTALSSFYESCCDLNKMYFDYFKLNPGDVVIEGGVWDGVTTGRFSDIVGDKGKIFAFEPWGEKYIEDESLLSFPQVNIISKALSKNSEKVFLYTGYADFMPGASYCIDHKIDDSVEVEAISIDEFMHDNDLKKLDFIKLDVEGAELDVIEGARSSIEKYKPTMALSIYHKQSHMYEIPLKVLEIMPDYSLYYGHYSPHSGEAIMYFFPS